MTNKSSARSRYAKTNGRKNKDRVDSIRGKLTEDNISALLEELKREGRITDYRPANPQEEAQRCDFIVDHKRSKFAIQVKSSKYGASEFEIKEKNQPKKGRRIRVMIFVTSVLFDKDKDVKRLGRAINTFTKGCVRE